MKDYPHQPSKIPPRSNCHYDCRPDIPSANNPSYNVVCSNPEALQEVKRPSKSKCGGMCICLSIVVGFILICVMISMAAAAWNTVEVRKVSSSGLNFLQSQLGDLQDANTATNNQLNNFMKIFSGQFPFIPASSCSSISSSSPSGYYWVRASNGSAVRVYCDMTRSCGGVTGGWTRVANLQFQNPSDPCPEGFRERSDSGTRTCGMSSPTSACPSILFDTYGIPYSRVCGKILAHQYGSPDGLRRGENITIDSDYVDGVNNN